MATRRVTLFRRWHVMRDVKGNPTRTLIDETGSDVGRMDTPELAALVVEAVNEHLEAIEAGKRVAAQLANDVRGCPVCHGSGLVCKDPKSNSLELVKCMMCTGGLVPA